MGWARSAHTSALTHGSGSDTRNVVAAVYVTQSVPVWIF